MLDEMAAKFAELTGQPWDWQNTGGGCTALMFEISENHYLMVTHSEDASVPEVSEPHCVGEYVEDEAVNYWYFPNRRETVKFLKVWESRRVDPFGGPNN